MASTSASCVQKSFKYDVFLSFRGEDTRKNFVDNLYQALQNRGVYTYKDDEEIKKGKKISDELIKSIEDSKFYIIVFSKNYASSSWCLDELVKIMECQKTSEHTAYPVFFDVEPTEVRKQIGVVGEAFSKHKEEEGVQKWREALKEAAVLAGWELKTTFDGHEAKFIQKIVEEISLELRFINTRIDRKLIGMKKRVKEVVSSLETDVDDVRMIGIKGIGGGGKTTLARVVFDQISFMFEGSSFIENVREAAKGSFGSLESLKKQLLSDVLNDPEIIKKGVFDLKRMVCTRKVLIVLDDVDNINQLEALAGEPNWFKCGSRIIITTREEQVLVAHGVPKNLILDVNMLSPKEAISLFNMYAFGNVISNQSYAMLSSQVVSYAAGLPLTIKVLGSFLCGKDELLWIEALQRLKTIPLNETLKKMELSYESLEEEDYKEIFLDVVCILKGWMKEDAIIALKCCGFYARNGLKVLEQKALISVSGTGHLTMHDHIEEMGKNIVRRLHPNEPHRHSRLWIRGEVENILVQDKGTKETRCLKVRGVNPITIMKGLKKTKELRFLDVGVLDDEVWFSRCNDVGEDSLYLPNSLRYLCWDGYPFTCLPNIFQANNLGGIKMSFSNIEQLLEAGERKVLNKLKFIDMSNCIRLRSLDIGLIPNLERLSLVACMGFTTLDLEQAHNLDTLEVEECLNLTELRVPLKRLKLKHLTYKYCSSSMLETINNTQYQNLEMLDLECKDLVELYFPVEKLKRLQLQCPKMKVLNLTLNRNLEALGLSYCENLVELHMPIESLKLKTINIYCPKLKTLNLLGSRNLECLKLQVCKELVDLQMPIESNELKNIDIQYSKLRNLNLLGFNKLELLSLIQCEELVEVQMPNESPKLKIINIYCSKLRTFDISGSQNLKKLNLGQCQDLVELLMATKSPKLKTIIISCSTLETLNLTAYRNLERLSLERCEHLVELHMPIKNPRLTSIIIHYSKLRTLNLTPTRNLKCLDLKYCEYLIELHMPIESLKLTCIMIHYSKLRTLNLMQTRNLLWLDLKQCEELVELLMATESPKLKTIMISRSTLRTLNLTAYRNVERLSLERCEHLVELHMPIESPRLTSIVIHYSKLRTLNLTPTRNLECLDLKYCDYLIELHMPIESLKLTCIMIHNSRLRTLNLMQTRNLVRLDLKLCEDLVELQMPIESPKLVAIMIRCFKFVELHVAVGCLSASIRFKPLLVNQRFLMVGSFDNLHLIARSLGICSLQPDNSLPKFHFEWIYKELSLSSTQNIANLIPFGLCACTNLASLSRIICGLQLRKLTLEGGIPEVPKEIEQLEHLEELTLLSTNIEHLPDSICMLKHLKVLQIKSCWFLQQLPEDLGRLESLEDLRITDCTSLRVIPNSICEMKCLKCFHLRNCILVGNLPKEIGRLKCLKELNIQGTGITDIPESLFHWEDLLFSL